MRHVPLVRPVLMGLNVNHEQSAGVARPTQCRRIGRQRYRRWVNVVRAHAAYLTRMEDRHTDLSDGPRTCVTPTPTVCRQPERSEAQSWQGGDMAMDYVLEMRYRWSR